MEAGTVVDEGVRLAQELEQDISLEVNKMVNDLKADAVGEAALKVFSAKVKVFVQKTNELMKNMQASKVSSVQFVAALSSFLQDAFREVSDTVSGNADWQQRSARERTLAVEAAEMYLNRLVFNSVFCTQAEASMVDDRLSRLFDALSFVELRQFRMPDYLVAAIEKNTSHFAAAVSALYSLQDRHTEGNKFPRDKLRCFALFYNHLVKLIAAEGGQGNADELMDVALYTLIVVKPSSLYGTVRYIEQFRWAPFATAGFSGFLLGWVESLIATVYTLDTDHFDIERDIFLAHMVSSGFEAAEFEPRPRGTPLPAPFGRGPPLGQTADSPGVPSPPLRTPSASPSELPQDSMPTPSTSERGRGAAESDGAPTKRSRSRTGTNANASGSTSSSHRRDEGGGAAPALPGSIADIEAAGAERLRNARNLQLMHRLYPFLQQHSQDLFLKDVGELLSQYQDVVIKYESLRAGLKKFGIK